MYIVVCMERELLIDLPDRTDDISRSRLTSQLPSSLADLGQWVDLGLGPCATCAGYDIRYAMTSSAAASSSIDGLQMLPTRGARRGAGRGEASGARLCL